MDFQTLVNLGRATSTHMASVAAALDHCHVPGRTGEWQIPAGRMEIGLGLHNETVSHNERARSASGPNIDRCYHELTRQGVFNIPQPSGEELITRLLDLILNQDDPERSFVKFKEGDDLVLLVNNQGGMSALEMGAVVDETLSQLGMSFRFIESFSCLSRFCPVRARTRLGSRPTRSCSSEDSVRVGVSLSSSPTRFTPLLLASLVVADAQKPET
jgi:hypothetical protein